MEKEEYLDGIHLRIARVTEDLRVIQRELNCAAMQAPNDPELMEALSALPETEVEVVEHGGKVVGRDAVGALISRTPRSRAFAGPSDAESAAIGS